MWFPVFFGGSLQCMNYVSKSKDASITSVHGNSLSPILDFAVVVRKACGVLFHT